MTPLRLAVIGVGHLGRVHARLAAGLPEIELVAVVDPSSDARNSAAEATGARPFASYLDVLGMVDAAVVATPTRTHLQVAGDLIRGGLHVLVEKPIAPSYQEADELVQLARRMQSVLQVGHVERFNPGFHSAAPRIAAPKFIEARRCSSYPFRSTDVGVVMDLMIHDIDLVLTLVKSTLVDVDALGVSVMGGHEDMVNARLRFANGAVACLSASRTSYEPARIMHVYSDQGFSAIDFAARSSIYVEPSDDVLNRRFSVEALSKDQILHLREHLFQELLVKRQMPKVENNAIEEELKDFANAAAAGAKPRVTGTDGRDAVAVAENILHSVAEHRWDGAKSGRIGPLAMPVQQMQDVPDAWSSEDTTILPRRAG